MVKIENLVKKYSGFELNISMEIKKGTIVGLVGQNGAGKSTTIKSILGLIKPDEGCVKICDKNVRDFKAEEKAIYGAALSSSCFNKELNAKDVSKILNKMYFDFDRKDFLKKCEKQHLDLEKKIGEYSTGMKARLKVLVAMSHNAKLLILDEPTAGLDVIARNNILDMLRAYMAEDEERAILISSHISSDLEGLCDEIYMIDDGKITLHEDTDTILSQYGLLKVPTTEYDSVDKQYIIKTIKESFGYSLLTNEKDYYTENYPQLVIEKIGIDDLMVMMNGGK